MANEKAKATPGMAIVENNIYASAVPGMAIVENNIYASAIPGMAIVEADEEDVFDISRYDTLRQSQQDVAYNFDTNVGQIFRYENAGYVEKVFTETTPVAPDDTQSHNGLAITVSKTREKMFDIPETKEFWLKFDAWIKSTNQDFRVYAYNSDFTGVRINSGSSTSTPWIHGNNQSDIKKSYDGLHTFLLHVKSSKTKGVFELYDESGLVSSFKDVNVNNENVFKGIFIQSDSPDNVYISNIILSNASITIEENAKLEDNLVPLSKLSNNGVIGEDDIAVARSDNNNNIYRVFNGTVKNSGYDGYLYKDYIAIYLKDRYDIEYLSIHNNDTYNCNVTLLGSYDNKNFEKIAESGTNKDTNRFFYKVPYYPYYHLCCDNGSASVDAIHIYGHKDDKKDYLYDTNKKTVNDVENDYDTLRRSPSKIGLHFNGDNTYASIPVSLRDCVNWSVSIKLATTHITPWGRAGTHQPAIFGYDSQGNNNSRDFHVDIKEGYLTISNGLSCNRTLGNIKYGKYNTYISATLWETQQFIADGKPHSIDIECRNRMLFVWLDGKPLGMMHTSTTINSDKLYLGASLDYERVYAAFDLFDFRLEKDGDLVASYRPTDADLINKKMIDRSGHGNDGILEAGDFSAVRYQAAATIIYCDTQRKSNIEVESLFDTSREPAGRIGLRFNGSDTYASIPVSLKDCTDWSVDLKLATTHVSHANIAGYHQPTIFGYDSPGYQSRDFHIDVSEGNLFIFNGLLCDASRCDIKAGILGNYNDDISWKTQQFIADGNPHSIRVECRHGMLYVWLDGKCLGAMHTQTTIDSKKLYLGASFDSEKVYAAFDLFDFQLRKDGELVASYKPNDAEVANRKLMVDHSGHGNDSILEAGNFTMVDYREQPTIIYCDTQRDVGRHFAVTNIFDTIRRAYDGISTELDTNRKLNRMLLDSFDSQRKIAGETADNFDTARKVAAYVESPDNLDTNRRVAVSSSDNLDAERKIGIELADNLDSHRKLQNDADNVFDTSREVKTLIEALSIFDTGRELYAVPLSEFDTQRMVHANFSMTNDYDTARKLKGDHAEGFDADRKLVGTSLDSFDSKRSTTAKQLDGFDSARATMREIMDSADTYRSLQADLGNGFDSRRAVANNAEDAFDSQRSISNEAAGEFDSVRKTSAQASNGFDSARNVGVESEGDYGTARTVNAYDTEAFNTARKTAADTADAFDSMRKTSTNAAGSLDTSRQIQAGASCTGDTERDVHADAFAEVNTSRKTTCDVAVQNDTSRKPVAKEEDMFDTCVEYIVTNFFFDTSRKITIPRYDGFNTVHKEVVGAVNEIYADLKCARRAAAEADLKAQKNKESIAELNAKVASIKVIGGGSSVEGPAGPKGDRGDIGPAGPSGADGKSAMDIANELRLKKGYKPFASEEDFIESLRGKSGEDGRDGRDGTDAYVDPASLADNSALVNKYVAKADMIDAQGKEIYAKAADVDKKADRLYVDEALNDKAEAIAVTALMTAVHNKQEKGDYVTKDEMNAMLANTMNEAGVKAIVTALLSSDAIKKMISDAVAEAMSKQ